MVVRTVKFSPQKKTFVLFNFENEKFFLFLICESKVKSISEQNITAHINEPVQIISNDVDVTTDVTFLVTFNSLQPLPLNTPTPIDALKL